MALLIAPAVSLAQVEPPPTAWASAFGSSSDDESRAVALDGSGNVLITGSFQGTVNFGGVTLTSAGNDEIFALKLDSDGSVLWAKSFGGSNVDQGFGIAVDAGGNVFITGGYKGTADFGGVTLTSAGNFDVVALKLDPDGNTLWAKSFGGSKVDQGSGIAVDAGGNVFITGIFDTTADFGGVTLTSAGLLVSIDIFALKLDPEGNRVWAKSFGGMVNDVGFGIAVDGDGNVLITGLFGLNAVFGGVTLSSAGELDIFALKLDPDGNRVWAKRFGGSDVDQGRGIAVDGDGNVLITGFFQDNEGDIFALKLDPEGNTLWTRIFGGVFSDHGTGIAVDGAGDVLITGFFHGTVLFGGVILNSAGGQDAFALKLDPDGNTLWATNFGGTAEDQGTGIAVDGDGNALITGDFREIAHFSGVTLVSAGNADIFVVKLSDIVPPTANAGADQSVDEGVVVNLDGSGSGPAEALLTFQWSQVGGPAVALSDSEAEQPFFDSPFVSSNTTLTFELVVTDTESGLDSDPDLVNVTVVNSNSPPNADAGDDQEIKPGRTATLNAGNSFDLDGTPLAELSFTWTQGAGPVVALDTTDPVHPTFVVPNLVGQVLVFKLQVSDGQEASTPSEGIDSTEEDTVAVTIVANAPPVADAGPDQTRDEGAEVTLAGAGSDPDGDGISFSWTQISGPDVGVSGSTTASVPFTAPAVEAGGAALEFVLTVADDDPINLMIDFDAVTVNVLNSNDPPSCNLAQPSVASLWPPTHKLVSVAIEGVTDTDSEYNTVTLTVTGITQDEPVSGLGDGDTSPDGVIQGASALLRAERSGTGNGRVYVVHFTADDGFESCTGSVQVTVPHGRKGTATDDGQSVDSTTP